MQVSELGEELRPCEVARFVAQSAEAAPLHEALAGLDSVRELRRVEHDAARLQQVSSLPSLVNGTPSLVNGTPSLVHGTPALVDGTPSLVNKGSSPQHPHTQAVLLGSGDAYHPVLALIGRLVARRREPELVRVAVRLMEELFAAS